MDKVKAWCKHSLTIAWARLVTFASMASAAALALAADPATMAVIKDAVSPIGWLCIVVVIGLMTEAARRRTVSSATDENNRIVS